MSGQQLTFAPAALNYHVQGESVDMTRQGTSEDHTSDTLILPG